MEMQVSTGKAAAFERYLADNGILLLAMESALFLVVLTLSILFTLLALSYLRTYFRLRLETKIASKSSERRPKIAIPLTRPAPEESV